MRYYAEWQGGEQWWSLCQMVMTGRCLEVGNALAKLKRRGCKLIWLNPLLGWKDYQPVAASMAAALPHIDYFAPCNTLDSLRDLEQELHHL